MPEETWPRFRYLHENYNCWYEKNPVACFVCGQERPGYGFMAMEQDLFHSEAVRVRLLELSITLPKYSDAIRHAMRPPR